MEGYLLKKGRHASLHTWHRRFFVLRQAAPQVFILEQYLTEFEHGAPKHAMNVAGASVSQTPETPRGVRLTTVDGDTLELRADTPEEMEEWRRAFRTAAAAAAAEEEPPSPATETESSLRDEELAESVRARMEPWLARRPSLKQIPRADRKRWRRTKGDGIFTAWGTNQASDAASDDEPPEQSPALTPSLTETTTRLTSQLYTSELVGLYCEKMNINSQFRRREITRKEQRERTNAAGQRFQRAYE